MPKEIAFKKQFYKIIFLMVMPFIACLIAYTLFSFNSVLTGEIARSNREKVTITAAALQKNLLSIEDFMQSVSVLDTDFHVLRSSVGKTNAYLSSHSIMQKSKYMMSAFSLDMGFILYSRNNDLYRHIYTEAMKNGLKYSLRASLPEIVEAALPHRGSWFYYRLQELPCLIRVYGDDRAYFIGVINLNSVIEQSNVQGANGMLLLTDLDGTILPVGHGNDTDSAMDFFHLPEKAFAVLGHSPRYLAVSYYCPSMQLHFLYLEPYGGILSSMNMVQRFLFFCSIIAVLPLLGSFWLIRRIFFQPLDQMTQVMERIRDGDMAARMSPAGTVREFKDISVIFNDMIDQISNLRVLAYERELSIQKTRIQYLQIQIRPHFYLNCMKSLYGLVERREYTRTQNMIIAFSDYLRNMLQATSVLIPLSQEALNIRTYLNLQRLCGARGSVFEIAVDPSLEDVGVPPLSILTFVENAVKYGTLPNRDLTVCIKIHRIVNDDGDYLCANIMDNGHGFPDFVLKSFCEGDFSAIHGIGIANVIQRIQLLYNGAGHVYFSNVKGACVELFLPVNPDSLFTLE